MNKKSRAAILFLAAAFVFSGIYLYYENNSLQKSEYVIRSKKLPQGFCGFKIAHISDYHNSKSEKLAESLAEETRKSKPDIIVVTGDLIDSRHTNIKNSIKLIKIISEIAPIYYVPGNHEARIPEEYQKLKTSLEENGVTVLENKAVSIFRDGSEILLLGIADPLSANEPYVPDSEIVKTELQSIKNDKDTFKIILSHRPELFEEYKSRKIDLVFAGHAHGGQLILPLVGSVYAPNQGLFPKYTAGVFNESGTAIVVSRGIGNSLFPFRVNNRPELVITVLEKV